MTSDLDLDELERLLATVGPGRYFVAPETAADKMDEARLMTSAVNALPALIASARRLAVEPAPSVPGEVDLDELERLYKRWLHCEFSEDPVCREMEEALADGLPSLIASARRLAELEARIQRAMDMADNRWEEWGDRALRVAEILDGEEVDDA